MHFVCLMHMQYPWSSSRGDIVVGNVRGRGSKESRRGEDTLKQLVLLAEHSLSQADASLRHEGTAITRAPMVGYYPYL